MNIWELEACPLQRGHFYCVLGLGTSIHNYYNIIVIRIMYVMADITPYMYMASTNISFYFQQWL